MGRRVDGWMGGWVDGWMGLRFTVQALYRLPHTLHRLPCTQNLIAFGYTVPQLCFHRLEI